MAIAVFLADGFEEIEALTVADLTRRAELETWLVSVTESMQVTGSHGIVVNADKTLSQTDFTQVDMIVLPGGMPGTLNLEKCEKLMEKVREFDKEKKFLAAICAAPTIFGHLGLLKGREACCYPDMEDGLAGAEVSYDKVTVSGHIITSRGMGTAIDFGLRIVETFLGTVAAQNLAEKIVFN